MAISPRNTKKLFACLGVAAATAALGAGYSAVAGGLPLYGAVAGLFIGLLLATFELFFVQTPAGAWLRRLPLALFIVIATLVWALLIGFSVYVAAPYLLAIEVFPLELDSRDASALTFSFGLALLLTFFLRIQSLIGGRVLFNFLMGRYHQPAREERVFMFLDIANSTRLSEQFGDVKIQALIGRFFFDIARPIAEHDGETYRYIGDEVVVSWPMAKAIEDARCVRCVFDVQGRVGEPLRHLPLWVLVLISTIVWILSIVAGILIITPTVLNTEAYPEWYEQSTFLQDATFFLAAALLVYFGDTINTTARLRGLAKKIQRGLVISAALLEHMRLPDGVRAEDMGAFELSGKAEATRVYAVHGATS